jgi:hypothetical protein
MKKLSLLFTLMLVGSGSLKGMQEQSEQIHLPKLPEEVIHTHIFTKNNIKSFIDNIVEQSGDNLDLFINNLIEKPDLFFVNKQLYNMIMNDLTGFTILVHMLADKFDVPTQMVADQFNTPIAKQYVQLASKLIEAIRRYHYNTTGLEEIAQLIEKGADINYSTFRVLHRHNEIETLTPLYYGTIYGKLELMKFLLDAGANPNYEIVVDQKKYEPFQGTLRDYIRDYLMGDREHKEKMYQLLDETIKK